jgi:hypothetical protein
MNLEKRIFLIIEGYKPSIHENKKEAEHFVNFVRDTSKDHKNLKAMYCSYSGKEISEGFSDCIFKSI